MSYTSTTVYTLHATTCIISLEVVCSRPNTQVFFFETIERVPDPCVCVLVKSGGGGEGGGSSFPYILLNEIQTMFSQLAKQSSRQ